MQDKRNSMIASTADVPPQTITGSALNTGNIDTKGFDALTVLIAVGAISEPLDAGSPPAYIDCKIEHADESAVGSDTPGSYTACADADVVGYSDLSSGVFLTIGTNGDTDENTVFRVGYVGDKRYVKVTLTPTGLSTGGAVAVIPMLGAPLHAPAA